MDKTAVLEALRGLADPSALQGMSRFGIDTANAMGVSMPQLRALGRRMGQDANLATELWASGSREARILATLIVPKSTVDEGLVMRWLEDVNDWETCDQLCMNLIRHHPSSLEWAARWADDERLFVRRAAFATVAAAAVSMKGVDRDPSFISLLELVERHAEDGRPLVRKSMAWAMRSIARRGDVCRTAVMDACLRMEGSPSRKISALGYKSRKELEVRYG